MWVHLKTRRHGRETHVVGDRADTAALLTAVTVEVHAAAGGWRVVGVDEVERRTELAIVGVAEGVRPRRNGGEVRVVGDAKDTLSPIHGLVFKEVLRNEADGHVAKAAPCTDSGQRRYCECGAGDGVHLG